MLDRSWAMPGPGTGQPMSFGHFIRCTLFGQCSTLEVSQTVSETRRLLRETAAEWKPIKERIAEEAQARPDLAAMLQEARMSHERVSRDS